MEWGELDGAVPAREVLYERRPVAAVGALLALAMSAFYFGTTESLPIGLLQVISGSLKCSVSAVGLLLSAYAGVVVVASVPLTHVTKQVPRRPLLCFLLATFVVATAACAAAGNYWLLLGARLVTAMAQALFWAVVAVTAVGLFPARARAKVVAVVMGGGSVAGIVGVPAGTWIGQQGGWRLPFVLLSAVGVANLVTVATLLPTTFPAESHAATGSQPDRRRYQVWVVTTVLVVTGWFTAYTYVSAFLTRVAGLPARDIAPVLLLSGLSGAIGVAVTGALFDKHRHLATVGPVVVIAGAVLGLYLVGTSATAAVALEAVAGFGVGCFVTAGTNRVLILAPGSADVANAWASASFNVGILGGSLVGSVVVAALGVHPTVLVGGLVATSGLVVLASDQLAHRRLDRLRARPKTRSA